MSLSFAKIIVRMRKINAAGLYSVFAAIVLISIFACSSVRKVATGSGIESLRLINVYEYPKLTSYKESIVGGLSGIDYDSKRNVYYIICDDPSAKGPARFYTASISLTEKGIDSVILLDMTPFRNEKGETYADITKDRIHSADIEAMRYDAKRGEFIISTEGQRVINADTTMIQNPAVMIMNNDGKFIDSFSLPSKLHFKKTENGPRHNGVFEGLDFDEDNRYVFVSVESPLYDDGLAPAGGDTTGWSRIIKFDRETKKAVAQYAYPLDAVPYPANPPGAFKINGISDILYLGENKLLVIERGYSTGRLPSDVRVYIADMKGAEDVSDKALKTDRVKKPIQKKLLMDMNNLGHYIDNVEGVTLGPVLPNGHRTLLFISDDNFDPRERTQFFLFEVLP